MTHDEIQKVRTLLCDAIITPELWDMRDEVFAILDRELAKPVQEPVAYWDGESLALPPADLENIPNWSDYYRIPLYRHPAPQSAEQEPVVKDDGYIGTVHVSWYLDCKSMENVDLQLEVDLPRGTHKIYAAPPSREWQGLTDDDRIKVFNSLENGLEGFLKTWGWLHFAKAIEAALKEKNHG